MSSPPAIIDTDFPARLDRLQWTRFHTLVVMALGITWVLDGLEVTLAGAVSGALMASPQLHLTEAQVGAAASAYLGGAVLGAFVFGWLTDLFGRKRLFSITLGLYLAATAASALAPNFWIFALFRFLTGAGIGGEYTAINSAIQELVPARFRGRTDLAINGSFWLGAAFGALGTVVLLRPGVLPPDIGCGCADFCRKVRAGCCSTAAWRRRIASPPALKPTPPMPALTRRRRACVCTGVNGP